MTIFLFNYNANGGNAQGESRKYVRRCGGKDGYAENWCMAVQMEEV